MREISLFPHIRGSPPQTSDSKVSTRKAFFNEKAEKTTKEKRRE